MTLHDRTADSRLFTSALFDHTFDIDDVITALCGSHHRGRWLLHTRAGELVQEAQEANNAQAPTAAIQDGDDEGYWHVIEPLPASFLQELANHYELKLLPPDVQQAIMGILSTCTSVADLPATFEGTDETTALAGGWLRQQVKAAALEWLDARNMIPPSMRHVRDQGYSNTLPSGQVKVTIG